MKPNAKVVADSPPSGAESTILRLLAGSGPRSGRVGARRPRERRPLTRDRTERALLTIVFTDMVGSTETAERLRDYASCTLLLRNRDVVRTEVARCEGREVYTASDGFFMGFDRPSGAVRFASAVTAAPQVAGRRGQDPGVCHRQGPCRGRSAAIQRPRPARAERLVAAAAALRAGIASPAAQD